MITSNKVASSGIIALDLIDFIPNTTIVTLDIKDYMYEGLIVKEKEFKDAIAAIDTTYLADKAVAVICTADAIIPLWGYMVMATKLAANTVYFDFKNPQDLHIAMWKQNFLNADLSVYNNEKVVVIARATIPPALYMLATTKLKPLVKTLLYGEVGMPKVILKN